MLLPLETSIEDHGNKKIIRLKGRLDASSSPPLEKKIEDMMHHASLRLLIDFSEVDYLSSAGLRLMLAMTKKMRLKGAHLAFSGIQDDVMEIIKMAGFERMLPIFSNEQQALAALD